MDLTCLLEEQLLEPTLNLKVHCRGLESRGLNCFGLLPLAVLVDLAEGAAACILLSRLCPIALLLFHQYDFISLNNSKRAQTNKRVITKLKKRTNWETVEQTGVVGKRALILAPSTRLPRPTPCPRYSPPSVHPPRSSNPMAKVDTDTSSSSWNDADVNDADIRHIYDEKPMAEAQLTVECNVFVTGKHHTEQLEFNNEGVVDQNAEQCHDTRPLPAKLTDHQTTELSNQSLDYENICLKKTVAQFQKDLSKLKAHIVFDS
ncbi:hypothetical protein Tco_0371849 [Tanacetum coccineum]